MITKSRTTIGSGLCSVVLGAFLSSAATSTVALELVPKPGVQVNSAEFGTSVDRRKEYTLVSADQDGSIAPGPQQYPGGISARNGALYLFTDLQDEPLLSYQYVHTVERLGFDAGPGINPLPMNLGSNVALSDRWIVATMRYYPYVNGNGTPALFIADRSLNSGLGPICPEVNGVVDCYGVVEPLLLDEPGLYPGRAGFDIAASNQHIVYADAAQGVVQVLTYDESNQSWEKSSNFGAIPAGRGKVTVDISRDFMVVAVPPTLDDPYSGRVYYSRWNGTSGWSSLQAVTSITPGFGRSVAINSYNEVVVGSGIGNTGSVNFYKPVYSSGSYTLQSDGMFSQVGTVPLVAIDGNQAMAYLQDNGDTVKVFRQHSGYVSANQSVQQWVEFGTLDNGAVNQLPNPAYPSYGDFFPTDMALSDGVAAFGWRGLGSQSANINLVGGLVRERVAHMYDPAADTLGLHAGVVGDGTVVLDEENALLSQNVTVLPLLGNSQNVGWFAQIRDTYGFATEWPIEVQAAGNYQVCTKYLNNTSQNQYMIFRLNGEGVHLAQNLVQTPGGYTFGESCFTLSLPAGRHAFGTLTFNASTAFDQITIE